MSYQDAIAFLSSLQVFGAQLGLERVRRLAELAGNPQDQLRFVHVAGTNGKGSTCAMLEAIYRSSGRRVGLYTSPHLVSFRERFQVNRELISESDVVRLVGDAREWLQEFPSNDHPTFFEVVTVMALRYFAEQGCDLVIWETGLGGRLDATNIVMPLVSVITNVQFDHEKWLGDTLEKIAAEKAGIIKEGVPVVTATDSPEALAVIRANAARLNAPVHVVASQDVFTALHGDHQKTNAALALKTVEVLQKLVPVPSAAQSVGLQTVTWPGRFQMHERDGKTIILDGAHNPAGAAALASTLRHFVPGHRLTLLLGLLNDKNWEQVCRILAPLAARLVVMPVNSERTAQPELLAASCREANPAAKVEVAGCLRDALDSCSRDPYVVVTGSLYLIGEALELLQLSPTLGERALNEWSATPVTSRKPT